MLWTRQHCSEWNWLGRADPCCVVSDAVLELESSDYCPTLWVSGCFVLELIQMSLVSTM